MSVRKSLGLPVGLMMTVLAGLLVSGPALSGEETSLTIRFLETDTGQIFVDDLDPMTVVVDPFDANGDLNSLVPAIGYQQTFQNLTGQTFTDFHFEFPTIEWDVFLTDGGSFFDVFVEVEIDGTTSANFYAENSPGIKLNESYGIEIFHNYVDPVSFTYYPTVDVPEPTTLALLSLGLVGL